MTNTSVELGVSRARLYEFVGTYGLNDYVETSKKIFRATEATQRTELEITRKYLLASAIKAAVERATSEEASNEDCRHHDGDGGA